MFTYVLVVGAAVVVAVVVVALRNQQRVKAAPSVLGGGPNLYHQHVDLTYGVVLRHAGAQVWVGAGG